MSNIIGNEKFNSVPENLSKVVPPENNPGPVVYDGVQRNEDEETPNQNEEFENEDVPILRNEYEINPIQPGEDEEIPFLPTDDEEEEAEGNPNNLNDAPDDQPENDKSLLKVTKKRKTMKS